VHYLATSRQSESGRGRGRGAAGAVACAAGAILVTSERESFGLAALEALTIGLDDPRVPR